jgi:tetratricopeptide (TPR) repeat protein
VTRQGILGAMLILGAAISVVPLSLALEARSPRTVSGAAAAPVLPRAAVLRPLLLGFHPLAADLYWLRTIQYFGAHIQTDRKVPHLHALVDLVTSLDPHFVEAYQLGGLFLDIAGQYPEAIAIYKKGIAANPSRWELPHDLGRLYYLELKDYAAALQWWQVTNRLPNHPHYMERFIDRLYARTGHAETALELWQAIYEKASHEWVRETAKREIDKILEQTRGRAVPGAGT